jgi:Hedgehog amino-terminal signalling domain
MINASLLLSAWSPHPTMLIMWPFPDIQRVNLLHFLFFCILMLRFVTSCDSCGPGKTGFKRSGPPKKYLTKPLREKQYLPKVDEYSHKASGPSEGKILRKTRRFRNNLVRVDSPNIIFRDEERTGADRYMTRVSQSINQSKKNRERA